MVRQLVALLGSTWMLKVSLVQKNRLPLVPGATGLATH